MDALFATFCQKIFLLYWQQHLFWRNFSYFRWNASPVSEMCVYLHNKHEPTTRILLNKQKSYQNKPYRISPLIETICCNLLQKRDEPSDNIPVSNALVTCFACLAQRTCSKTDPQHLFTRHCHVIRSWCNTVQLWYLHLHDCEFFFFSNLREPGYKIFPVFVKENKIKYSSVPIHLNFIHGNSVL